MKYDCVSHMRRCAVYCGMSLRWNMYFGLFRYYSSNIFVWDLALKIYDMSYDEQLNMLQNICSLYRLFFARTSVFCFRETMFCRK